MSAVGTRHDKIVIVHIVLLGFFFGRSSSRSIVFSPVGRIPILFSSSGAIILFLDIKLALPLHDIVARTCDVHGGVLGLGVAFDGVAALGLNSNFTLIFLFGNFAAGTTTTIGPGYCKVRISALG